MAANEDWKNPSEEAAYKRLNELKRVLASMGLDDTSSGLGTLLDGRIKRGRWNWGVFEHCVNRFESEIASHHPTYKDGLDLIKGVLHRTFETKRSKGKRLNLFEVPWTSEDETRIATTLGVIMNQAQEAVNRLDVPTAVLLAGLGHIIRYEIRGDFARRRIESWAAPSVSDPKARARLVNRFLTLEEVGTDGKPDTFHVRNAFAHGHFAIRSQQEIDLWDTNDKGRRTYSGTFTPKDILGLSNVFEKKLKLVEVYPSLLVAIEDLFHIYRREWRLYRSPVG